MHGLLRRLFAPRWQHPDPTVRRQALDRLDPAQPDHQKVLKALSEDTDPGIRLAALCASNDLAGLMEGYTQHSDNSAWFEAIAQRLSGKTGQIELGERLRHLALTSDIQLLHAVAHTGDNLDLRLAALEKLQDEDDIIQQACHNGVVAVRHRAAERVISEQGLRRLLKESQRDRQVMRLARDRLNALKEDAEWEKNQRQKRDDILHAMEQQARRPWEPLYSGRLRHLEREWQQVEQAPDAIQEKRYHDALLACRKILHDHETKERERLHQEQQQAEAEQTREQLLDGLEESLEGLLHSDALNLQDIDSLRAQYRLFTQRWQVLADSYPCSDDLRLRHANVIKHYEQVINAWERWEAYVPLLEQALADNQMPDLHQHLNACRWPETLPPPALMQEAKAALAAQAKAHVPQHDQGAPSATSPDVLNNQLNDLENLLERGAFKSASRLYQRLKPHVDALDNASTKPLISRFRHLGARLAELRDWRGFVAGPKRLQLCESIEALADDQHMAEAALDQHHRQLVKEWKSLGDAAANRELSTRFRGASDRIHERLTPWREKLAQQRQHNLEARIAMCEQLEALLEQPAEDADPDVLREIRDKARQQWRLYSPVTREDAEQIGRRFGKVRHRLQALIDDRAQAIADQKQAMVDQAQALIRQEDTPIDERTRQLKILQQQWRSLGRAPKGQEQLLWKTFRQACDQLFAQRDAQKNEQVSRQQQRLEDMQALIERMDAWQPNHADDVTTLEAFLADAAALEPLPRNRRSDGMQKRLSGIVRARRERLERLKVAARVQQWQSILPLVNAHLEADQAVLDNTALGTDVNADDVLDTPLPAEFKAAHQQRNQQRHHIKTSPLQLQQLQDELARLRVHLSLLAIGRVKQSDEPLRLAIQVERLNEGFQQERSQEVELISILSALLALGPMPRSLWQADIREFDELLSRLSRLPPH
ncbi:MAG: DUF349 domain-containing protein [Halomonas sp.]|nr:DUF349 domain-containing protein [Halomonas sp.]TVM06953.1 MAG: DUF349 domain-containing protein [Halomonas sp.]